MKTEATKTPNTSNIETPAVDGAIVTLDDADISDIIHQQNRVPRNLFLKMINAGHQLGGGSPLEDDEKDSSPNSPDLEIAPHERTPDGLLELAWDYYDLQQELHSDFTHGIRKVLSRADLERRASAKIAEINSARGEDQQVDVRQVSQRFLERLIEPDWLNLTEEEIEHRPEELAYKIQSLQELDAKLRVLTSDEALLAEAHERRGEFREIQKVGIAWMRHQKRQRELADKIVQQRLRAVNAGRALSRYDQELIERWEAQIAEYNPENAIKDAFAEGRIVIGQEELLQKEMERQVRRHNWHELNKGLLMSPDMVEHTGKALPVLAMGGKVLLVGEMGGAKTALANYMANVLSGGSGVEHIEFFGDVNTYQLMGKEALRNGDPELIKYILEQLEALGDNPSPKELARIQIQALLGANIGGTKFVEGPVVRAMKEGKPLVIDEINAATPEVIKRLNDIFHLKPGATYRIQEDSGQEITVAPGFCIIATMNEKSSRYKGVDELSAEFKEGRIDMTLRVLYPDADLPVNGLPGAKTPPTLLALAEASLVDRNGEFLVDMPAGLLDTFVKAAHAAQKLFAGGLTEKDNTTLSSYRVDGEGLEKTTIDPRRMGKLLEIFAASRGARPLTSVIADWVKGIERPRDRQVLTLLLDNYVFINTDGQTESLLGNIKAKTPGEKDEEKKEES
jgi:hypothetical protein